MILNRLKEIRLRQALSMRELTERSGVTPTTIVRAERGKTVYPTTVRKLAAALGVTPAELRGDLPSPAAPEPPAPSKPDVNLGLARALYEVEVCRAAGDDAGVSRWEQIAAGIAQSAEAER